MLFRRQHHVSISTYLLQTCSSLCLEYFASCMLLREHAEGKEQKSPPGFVREKCVVTVTHHCLSQWEAVGGWRRTRPKRKGGSNFKRKEELTLNYCFISGAMQVSVTVHPSPPRCHVHPKQPSKEGKDLKGSCPIKESSQDLELQRSLG